MAIIIKHNNCSQIDMSIREKKWHWIENVFLKNCPEFFSNLRNDFPPYVGFISCQCRWNYVSKNSLQCLVLGESWLHEGFAQYLVAEVKQWALPYEGRCTVLLVAPHLVAGSRYGCREADELTVPPASIRPPPPASPGPGAGACATLWQGTLASSAWSLHHQG